jgi:hypothetical protein
MPATERINVSLDIDRGTVPITGRLVAAGVAERPFTGWTELFSALETAIGGAHPVVEEETA